jgi:hypothetical protein
LWRSALLALLFGCGYAPVRRAQSTTAVRVAPVNNLTAQAEAGGWLASELRSELSRRDRLAGDSSSAPELRTSILTLVSLPTSAGTIAAAAFRINADLRVKIDDWEDAIQGGEDYLSGVDVLGTEANRRAALRRLFRTLSKEIVDRYEVTERLK